MSDGGAGDIDITGAACGHLLAFDGGGISERGGFRDGDGGIRDGDIAIALGGHIRIIDGGVCDGDAAGTGGGDIGSIHRRGINGDIALGGVELHVGKGGALYVNLAEGKLDTGEITHEGIINITTGGSRYAYIRRGVFQVGDSAVGSHLNTAHNLTVGELCALQDDGTTGVDISIRDFSCTLGGQHEGLVFLSGNHRHTALEDDVGVHVDDIGINDDGVINIQAGAAVDVVVAEHRILDGDVAGDTEDDGVGEGSGINSQVVLTIGRILRVAYIDDGAINHGAEFAVDFGVGDGDSAGVRVRAGKSGIDSVLGSGDGVCGIGGVLLISDGDITTGGDERGIHIGIGDGHITGGVADDGLDVQLIQGILRERGIAGSSIKNSTQVVLVFAEQVLLLRNSDLGIIRNGDIAISTHNGGVRHGGLAADCHGRGTGGSDGDIRIGNGGGVERAHGHTGSIVGYHHAATHGNFSICHRGAVAHGEVATGRDVVCLAIGVLEAFNRGVGHKRDIAVSRQLAGLHGVHVAEGQITTGIHSSVFLHTQVLVGLAVVEVNIPGSYNGTGNIDGTGATTYVVANLAVFSFELRIGIHVEVLGNHIAVCHRGIAVHQVDVLSLHTVGYGGIGITHAQSTGNIHGISLHGHGVIPAANHSHVAAAGHSAQIHIGGIGSYIDGSAGDTQQALFSCRELVCSAGTVEEDEGGVFGKNCGVGLEVGVLQYHLDVLRNKFKGTRGDVGVACIGSGAAGIHIGRGHAVLNHDTLRGHLGVTGQVRYASLVCRINNDVGTRSIRNGVARAINCYLVAGGRHVDAGVVGIFIVVGAVGSAEQFYFLRLLYQNRIAIGIDSTAVYLDGDGCKTYGLINGVVHFVDNMRFGCIGITGCLQLLTREFDVVVIPTESIGRCYVVFTRSCMGFYPYHVLSKSIVQHSRYRNYSGNQACS